MEKRIIQTDKAPAPVGAYSQAVAHGATLFVSGQVALHPETGALVTDNIEDETVRVMENLAAILKAAGTGFDRVIKCEVFVSDIENFGRINAVYARYFDEATAPARALVEVANLPKYVNVEISCIAAL